MTEEKNNELVVTQVNYIKSNSFIEAKYKTSVFANKLLALGLSYLVVNEKGQLKTEIHASELRTLMNISDGGQVYKQIKRASEELSRCQMIAEDKANETFIIQNILQYVKYEKGVLSLTFADGMEKYIYNLKAGTYQTFNLPLMMSFKEKGSFKLYELIKLDAYKATEDVCVSTKFFGFSELLVSLGFVNTNNDKIQNALQVKNPDYDHIVKDLATEVSYKRWNDFKNRILKPAIEEISELSDYRVSFDDVAFMTKPGTCFYIIKKVENQVSDAEILEMLDELKSYIKEPISLTALKTLLVNSKYNVERVKKCYDVAKRSATDIKDLVAWLLAAIINPDFSFEEKQTVKGSSDKKESKNKFNNMDGRQMNFEDMEKQLVGK